MFNFMLNVFQSTLPREERPSIPPATPTIIDFNPRSHERSDCVCAVCCCIFCISIHAPTRGATTFYSCSCQHHYISIHAPTRGATTSTVPSAVSGVFQSTLPREERPFLNFNNPVVMNFNTRSHERSDRVNVRKVPDIPDFNPRSHERSDV